MGGGDVADQGGGDAPVAGGSGAVDVVASAFVEVVVAFVGEEVVVAVDGGDGAGDGGEGYVWQRHAGELLGVEGAAAGHLLGLGEGVGEGLGGDEVAAG